MDYFTLLNLPVAVPVDKTQLNNNYQQLQRQFHPDNFAHATPAAQREAVQKSAMINDAYHRLKHPLRSVEYFLSLHDVDVFANTTVHDTDFLLSQLELREKLDDIEQLPSLSQQEFELTTFSSQVNAQESNVHQQLSDCMQTEQWIKAGEIVVKLQFFEKLKQQIEQVEEKLY